VGEHVFASCNTQYEWRSYTANGTKLQAHGDANFYDAIPPIGGLIIDERAPWLSIEVVPQGKADSIMSKGIEYADPPQRLCDDSTSSESKQPIVH